MKNREKTENIRVAVGSIKEKRELLIRTSPLPAVARGEGGPARRRRWEGVSEGQGGLSCRGAPPLAGPAMAPSARPAAPPALAALPPALAPQCIGRRG